MFENGFDFERKYVFFVPCGNVSQGKELFETSEKRQHKYLSFHDYEKL